MPRHWKEQGGAIAGVKRWGVGMAVQTRRKEGAFPIWTYLQLTCMACGTAMIILMGAIWAAAAFRADQVDLHDDGG